MKPKNRKKPAKKFAAGKTWARPSGLPETLVITSWGGGGICGGGGGGRSPAGFTCAIGGPGHSGGDHRWTVAHGTGGTGLTLSQERKSALVDGRYCPVGRAGTHRYTISFVGLVGLYQCALCGMKNNNVVCLTG